LVILHRIWNVFVINSIWNFIQSF